MINTLKARYRQEQFIPTWLSVFINSNYLIRKGIYKGIRENAHFMNGLMLDFECGIKPYRTLFDVQKYIGIDIRNTGHDNDISQIDVFYDGRTIPFEDNYFDSAYSSEVLTHISDIEPMIDEIKRVMKPGANLLVTVPFVWHENEKPCDAVRYTSFGIVDLLERHGFITLKQEKKGNYFTSTLQTRNAYLYHAIFPRSNLLKLLLTLIFIFPVNVLGIILSPVLGRNQDLFSNMVLVARKPEN